MIAKKMSLQYPFFSLKKKKHRMNRYNIFRKIQELIPVLNNLKPVNEMFVRRTIEFIIWENI